MTFGQYVLLNSHIYLMMYNFSLLFLWCSNFPSFSQLEIFHILIVEKFLCEWWIIKSASGHIGLNIFIRTKAVKMNPNNQQKEFKRNMCFNLLSSNLFCIRKILWHKHFKNVSRKSILHFFTLALWHVFADIWQWIS